MPVEEAIENNVEGRLIPLNQPDLLAKEVLQLLFTPIAVLGLALQLVDALCSTING